MHYSLIASFVGLSASLEGPKNGKKALKFIPNTPALVAWGQKPTTGHLSGLIYKTVAQEVSNDKK